MVKSRFWERYQADERVQVWRELIELSENVREEPLRSAALRVCEEIVRRARRNLRTLQARLLALGYEFAEPQAALVDAAPEAAGIDEVEQELGVFPLIARVWYSHLAAVNFCQADRQRSCRPGIRPSAGPDIFGLGSLPC